MLETKIKVLASLYTLILMAAAISLLFFSGFRINTPPVKGKLIQATMIDISQLTKKQSKVNNKKTEKKPIIKNSPKIIEKPIEKPIKKPVVKPTPIAPAKPKVDIKAQELERKARQERLKKLKEIREKRKAAEVKRKIEQQKLQDLAQKTHKQAQKATENIGIVKGKSEATKTRELMIQYQLAVIASVQRQWNKPASANKNLLCRVKVRQIPGGGVINATIATPCNANSIVRKSIIAAIQKADPLPYKGFEKVFDRTAIFTFQPQ